MLNTYIIRDNWYADISKVQEKLGHDPKAPIEKGLKRSDNWFKKVNELIMVFVLCVASVGFMALRTRY